MNLNCEISVEELGELLEENRKNYKLLKTLLKSAGVETEECTGKDPEEDGNVNLKKPVLPEKMNPYTVQKWNSAAQLLEEELSDFEENAEELESIKYLCRTKEEYADLEKEVVVSGKLINALQEVILLIEERERMRQERE